MIYDILEVFKKEYAQKGDKLILDNYVLKDGLYVKINNDVNIEYYIFKNSKKEDKKSNCFTDLEGNIAHEMYDWFKVRDYYSGYLDSNKSFYDKKIHNVNYLSLFVKIENFTSEFLPKIRGQYLALLSYKKFRKKEEIEVLRKYQTYLQRCSRQKDIVRKFRTIKENMEVIAEIAEHQNIKNYIKIFFDEDIDLYKKESEIYYAIKIFNDISYSKKIEKSVYGLPDSNMGLNSKKPYLEHKTRSLTTPFMILNEDAVVLKKFFDWLKFQELQKYYPLHKEDEAVSKHIFLQRDYKEKDLVCEYDYIPWNIDRFKESINVRNILNCSWKKGETVEDYTLAHLWQLEEKIDAIFYNKQLKYNYFNDDIKVSQYISKNLQTLIYATKTAMLNYFQKYDEQEFYQVVRKYGNRFVIEHLRQEREIRACEAMNLKLALQKYKGDEIMDIEAMQEKMIQKLDRSEYTPLTRDEFFYLAGQVTKYLISQSEAHEKNADLIEPFLRANNAQKLKKDIEFTYFTYKHKLGLNYTRFNNAMSLIMAYEGEDKLSKHMDAFLVGVLSDNIFYMKKEEK